MIDFIVMVLSQTFEVSRYVGLSKMLLNRMHSSIVDVSGEHTIMEISFVCVEFKIFSMHSRAGADPGIFERGCVGALNMFNQK